MGANFSKAASPVRRLGDQSLVVEIFDHGRVRMIEPRSPGKPPCALTVDTRDWSARYQYGSHPEQATNLYALLEAEPRVIRIWEEGRFLAGKQGEEIPDHPIGFSSFKPFPRQLYFQSSLQPEDLKPGQKIALYQPEGQNMLCLEVGQVRREENGWAVLPRFHAGLRFGLRFRRDGQGFESLEWLEKPESRKIAPPGPDGDPPRLAILDETDLRALSREAAAPIPPLDLSSGEDLNTVQDLVIDQMPRQFPVRNQPSYNFVGDVFV